MDKTNPELELADEFVNDTGCHVFLTGKAGTGKTTFLHNLRKKSPKRLVVAAPTGVAAINAGGVTLHSFFQLPFGPFVPGGEANRSQYRYSKAKLGIIKSLDLLVIDEISMVRADLLDGVDSVLRRYRRSEQPFGGVQLLMIGDLFQLPPVVREQDWQLLQPHYASPYFFSSRALGRTDMVTIELQHIYRQADNHFIDLLNRVRNNRADPATLEKLNARCIPDFIPAEKAGYITLSTHNRRADAINDTKLKALSPSSHRFEARIEGDFPEAIYPTASTLHLKPGAQVMFVRNDLSPERRYFNGKIGTITEIDGGEIRVRCPEDVDEILVEPATWENIEYTLNRKTMEIEESIIGTFQQIPLRLAWAITIHKSQGLTFDNAIIDAQAAFAFGQVYVALSRCRTLDGMVLSRPLAASAVKTDPVIVRFSQEALRNPPSREQLETARIQYQQRLLLECFDFGALRGLLRRTAGLILGNAKVVQASGVADIPAMQRTIEEEICAVGDSFQRQLQGLFLASTLPAADDAVLERIAKASVYFEEKIDSGPGRQIADLHVDTDNQVLKKKIKNALKFLRETLAVKLASVRSCRRGFSPSDYFRAVSQAAVNAGQKKETPKSPTYTEADIAHPELFQTLKAWRSRTAEAEGVPAFRVLHQKTLIQIAVHLPDTLAALQRIKGMGKRLTERYGELLVAMVAEYRREKEIETVILPEPAAPEKKAKPKTPKAQGVDTKQASLELFEKGMTLAQIAEERGLVLATIEGHMAHWVETGRVPVGDLVSAEKRQVIERELTRLHDKPFSAVKQALGDEFSYGEIRMVHADLKRQATSDEPT